jgi:hypothetical protein
VAVSDDDTVWKCMVVTRKKISAWYNLFTIFLFKHNEEQQKQNAKLLKT